MQQDWLGKVDDRLPLTSLGREIVSDRQKALDQEWLITNGIGGFGGASLSGALTRRYHGLLIAALQPPLGRTVLLSKLDERIEVLGQVFHLDVNEWRDGSASLSGLFYLERADLRGTLPTFVYRLPDGALHKTCWMEYGANTVYIRYEYNAEPSAPPLEIGVRALANCRDYHEDTKGSPDRVFKMTQEVSDRQNWTVEAWPGAPHWQLLVKDRPAQWRPEATGWYWGFHYRQEQFRGLTADEDLYCLGTWVASLAPGQSLTFVATVKSLEAVENLYPGALERKLTPPASPARSVHPAWPRTVTFTTASPPA